MSKMWRGPCEAVKASYMNPIATRLHRRAGEQSIFYDISHDGRSSKAWRLEKRGDTWHEIPLGAVEGGDPLNTYINASLEFTKHDAELYSLIARDLAARTDDLVSRFADAGKRLSNACDDLAGMISRLAPRYV